MANVPRIVVVGSCNTDMTVRAPRLPLPGETVLGDTFALAPGGKGANQAVAAARLGGDVTFIARVGRDSFGEAAVAGFEAEGIHTSFLVRDPDLPTGVALIGVDAQTGENSILVASGANGALCMADIDRAEAVIKGADVLICQREVRQDVVVGALEMAHQAGVLTILNPAPALPLPDYVWKYITVLTPNEAEAETLAGEGLPDQCSPESWARALRRLGVANVVVTLGALGALAVNDEGAMLAPPRVPSCVRDTTAAGDCFTGALAVALGEGQPLRQAVAFANAAASLSVETPGAQPSLPVRAAVEARLSGQAD